MKTSIFQGRFLVLLVCLVGSLGFPQQTATTVDGKTVILHEDGTWEYVVDQDTRDSDLENLTVYRTRTGKKYHSSGCRYLSKSKYPIALKDAVKAYGPCSVCNPPRLGIERTKRTATEQKEQKSLTVYVTRTGSKYHRSGCRYLRKSAIPKSLDEARKRYAACSVCAPPR